MVIGVAEAIDFGREHGQTVVNDVDDWYWGLDSHNAAYYASHPKHSPKENTNFYREVIKSSSIITVSTAFLADRMREMAPKADVIQIPNYIDVDRFTVVKQKAKPTLGWAGSTEHRSRDLETLRGVVNPFVTSGKYRLHHGGATWTDDGVIVDGFAEKVGVDPALVTSAPRTTAEDYPRLLTFDVGMVPLRDMPFNRAKSYIKGLEYAAAGIPFIAQGLPEYQELFRQWGDGFIVVQKPRDWVKALNRLTDLDIRLDMQAHCLDKVQGHQVEFGATRWIELLEGLVTCQ
jgi:glycosyltransferase involved in cell wall biosynthesis